MSLNKLQLTQIGDMNRFDLEEALMNLDKVGEDIDTIIYAIGDAPMKYTEDQLLNMLIGIKQLHDTRYEKAWNVLENQLEMSEKFQRLHTKQRERHEELFM